MNTPYCVICKFYGDNVLRLYHVQTLCHARNVIANAMRFSNIQLTEVCSNNKPYTVPKGFEVAHYDIESHPHYVLRGVDFKYLERLA